MFNKKRVFITDFIGLSNRLESLTLAAAIQQAYGHEVVVQWPEQDSLEIEGVRQAPLRWWHRPGSVKVRDCSLEQFEALSHHNTIILRGLFGPESLMAPLYLEVAERIRLKEALANDLIERLSPFTHRPVVGVHIRRGDFRLQDEKVYDAAAVRHPAVPLWWYERTMERIVSEQKETLFFLSCSGNPESFKRLRENFDIIETTVPSPYGYKGEGHQSKWHPVVDLFTLACCPTILATPISSFSHFAANALGGPTTTLLPPLKMAQNEPHRFDRFDLYGQLLPHWVKLCRGETVRESTPNTPVPSPASFSLSWLKKSGM